MTENRHYIKFMSDIIDSGVWGDLSPSARALYPVLLKFSNQHFKPVWPGTETLLGLTGFKSKKSIIQAKRDLVDAGLLHFVPGTGRKTSQYFFSFNYKGSKIPPQEGMSVHPWGGEAPPSGMESASPDGDMPDHPNNINITITNTQNIPNILEVKKSKEFENPVNFEALVEDYGAEIFTYAYNSAKKKGLEGNANYLRAICKNKIQENEINSNHKFSPTPAAYRPANWREFLDWASGHLTGSTIARLKDLEIDTDGNTMLVRGEPGDLLKSIILKYFKEESTPPVLVVFAESKLEKRVNLV